MPISTVCPNCKTPHNFLDLMYGQRARCCNCKKMFYPGMPERGWEEPGAIKEYDNTGIGDGPEPVGKVYLDGPPVRRKRRRFTIGSFLLFVFVWTIAGGAALVAYLHFKNPEQSPLKWLKPKEPVQQAKPVEKNPETNEPVEPPSPRVEKKEEPVKKDTSLASVAVELPSVLDQIKGIFPLPGGPATRALVHAGQHVESWDLKTGKVTGTEKTWEIGSDVLIDVSPNESLWAWKRPAPSGSTLTLWNTAVKKHVIKDKALSYTRPTAPSKSYKLHDFWFLDDSKGLVLFEDGALEIITIATSKRVGLIPPPISPTSGQIDVGVRPRSGKKVPYRAENYALSPDRKTFAIWNGQWFYLLDLGTTPRWSRATQPINLGVKTTEVTPHAVSFSPDNTRLAAVALVRDAKGKSEPVLACFDVTQTLVQVKMVARTSLPLTDATDLNWWGSRHVVVVGEKNRLAVVAVERDKVIAESSPAAEAKIFASTRDGLLWYALSVNRKARLIGVERPSILETGDGLELELTAQGIRIKQSS